VGIAKKNADVNLSKNIKLIKKISPKAKELYMSAGKMDFGEWVTFFFEAVVVLIGMAILAFFGFLLFFVGLDTSFLIVLPLKVFFVVFGFLLFMKPTLMAFNINRLWEGKGSIFRWMLGKKINSLGRLLFFIITYPIVLVILLPFATYIRLIHLPVCRLLRIDLRKYEEIYESLPQDDYKKPFGEIAYGDFFIGLWRFMSITRLWRFFATDDDTEEFGVSDVLDLNGSGQVVQHPHIIPIVLLNLILGGSGFFWIVAYMWARSGSSYFLNYDHVEDHNEAIKICPYCAEEVKLDAIKCKHCGEWLKGAG